MTTAWHVAATVDGHDYRTRAVPVIGHDLDDTAWLAARREGVGASEIASVCAVPGAYSSPFALWWAKTMGWDSERTFAMRVGQLLEEPIGQLFAEEHPGIVVVRPAARLYRHPDHAWMLASPDFLAVEQCVICLGDGFLGDAGVRCGNCDGAGGWVEPVECKSDEGRSWGDAPPLKHEMQTWQQCAVFGAARGHLVRLAGKKLSAYITAPSAEVLTEMYAAGAAFAASLTSGSPPAVDGSDATETALQRLYPPVADDDPGADVPLPYDLIAEFTQAHLDRARAVEAYKVARNKVRAAIGTGRWGVDAAGQQRYAEHRRYKRAGYSVGPCEIDEIRKAW